MKLRSILLLAGGLLISAAIADPMDAPTLLKKMNEAYAAIKTAKLTMESKGYMQSDGKSTIELVFAAPSKLKATLDGKTTYTTGGDMVAISDPSAKGDKKELEFDKLRLPWNLETMCFWDYKQQLSTEKGGNMETSKLKVAPSEKWNGRDWIVLEEEAPAQNVSVRYFIDPKTYLIWRTIYIPDGAEKGIESWITKLELDVKIDEAVFKAGK